MQPGLLKRFWIGAILATWALLVAGCIHPKANPTVLTGHPIQERYMSAQPSDGDVPCGVWRVQGARNVLYLVGTSHEVAADQVPFPSPFYAAYQDSRELFMEINPTKSLSLFTMPGLVIKMHKWMKAHQRELGCPPGKTLGDYLETDTVQRLKTFYGKNYARQEPLTPLGLLVDYHLSSGASQEEDAGGVEDVFAAQARKDRKPIKELDDKSAYDLATAILDAMLLELKMDINKQGADAVIKDQILSGKNEVEVDDVWRRGDLAAVERILEEIRREAPDLYIKLVPERNQKWMLKLKKALKADRNQMVLVGVAHMGGPQGLIKLLREAGFKVEQMYGVDKPKTENPNCENLRLRQGFGATSGNPK